MRFRETLEIEYPIDVVKRAYGKREFFLRRYAELGYSNVELRDDGGDGVREAGAATRLEMDWEVTAKLPLIGGKIEKLAAEEIRARMPLDAELSNRLIGELAGS